jgi:cold shock CspA family protein
MRGRVSEFDDAKGLGTIVDGAGTTFEFHVIEIADGTRTIDVGQAVVFAPLPRFGRIEAGRIEKV